MEAQSSGQECFSGQGDLARSSVTQTQVTQRLFHYVLLVRALVSTPTFPHSG